MKLNDLVRIEDLLDRTFMLVSDKNYLIDAPTTECWSMYNLEKQLLVKMSYYQLNDTIESLYARPRN